MQIETMEVCLWVLGHTYLQGTRAEQCDCSPEVARSIAT